MSGGQFDVIGVLRAFGISLAAALLSSLILRTAWRSRGEAAPRKRAIIVALAIGVLLLTLLLSSAWPSLVTVPSLGGLSRDQAEGVVAGRRLVPRAVPQHSSVVEAGCVVPGSQTPRAGLKVRPGTMVEFGVAVPPGKEPPPPPPPGVSISLFEPASGAEASCPRYPDGTHHVRVTGTSTGLAGSADLAPLLWIEPVSPPSDVPGWYLQRTPVNGIREVRSDGSWEGIAQVGDAQWPPHHGDILNVAVSVADRATVNRLMGEPGVVIRPVPIGVCDARASNVVVSLR